MGGMRPNTILTNLQQAWQRFPARPALEVMRSRFEEDRLGLTAGSLTFTTVTSLVPLATVALAIFSAFPKFAQMQDLLQKWMTQNLFPQAIASTVITYINEFANNASQLGWMSLLFLVFSAVALMLTVDGTLNKIWRVRTPRPLGQRILVYWAGLTLGPLALTVSVALSSYAVASSRGLIALNADVLQWVNNTVQFVLVAGMATAAYRFVPNTLVHWRYALAGGVFVAVGLQVARWGLGLYIGSASVASIYGAFAILPFLLLWLYVLWVIVLLGAVVAAYLPSMMVGITRSGEHAGFELELALEVLQALQAVQGRPERGLSLAQLTQQLQVSALQLESALHLLQCRDWIALVQETAKGRQEAPRYVLLLDMAHTPLPDLLAHTLLPNVPALRPLNAHIASLGLQVADVFPAPAQVGPASKV